MNTTKYATPKLPTTQNILDDISGSGTMQMNEKLKITNFEDIINDAYRCYMNSNTLKQDLIHQNDLNTKLEDLNKELVQNIENMKKQQ